MLRPRLTPIPPQSIPLRPLPARFSLLVWNVQKLRFERIERCLSLKQFDLWALQECRIHLGQHLCRPWAFSPNLQHGRQLFGVLTASRFGVQSVHQHLSHHCELRLLTHKSALLTRHLLADGRLLHLLNVHMLLTASHRTLRWELTLLSELLAQHADPIIVAGDFNSWSRPRLHMLSQWAEKLQLSWPVPQHAQHVRAHRQRRLDHLLYHGLTLRHFQARPSDCSDHNPLIAHFEI